MDRELDRAVRSRAGGVCEYCLMPQAVRRLRFPIDHIIARQHGGQATLENLALCCGRCNRHKGPNIAGIDPQTGQAVPLFHPRNQRWAEHFRWDDVTIIGITPIGRAIVVVLAMNHPDDLAVRREMIEQGWFLMGPSGQEPE